MGAGECRPADADDDGRLGPKCVSTRRRTHCGVERLVLKFPPRWNSSESSCMFWPGCRQTWDRLCPILTRLPPERRHAALELLRGCRSSAAPAVVRLKPGRGARGWGTPRPLSAVAAAGTRRAGEEERCKAAQGRGQIPCTGWSDLDPCTFIGRALRRQSVRYNQDTACLYRAVSAPRHLATRSCVGRPHDRWEGLR